MTAGRGASGAVPLGLVVVAALFLTTIGYLLVASLTRREQPTYAPSPVDPRPLSPQETVLDTLTVDARDAARWRFIDFERRSVVVPPDTAGWDLAVRRFRIIAAAGAMDLGLRDLEAVAAAPSAGYLANDTGRDTVNAALRRWYRYGFTSHLLEPRPSVYAIRTSEGAAATFQILSYYCPGLEAGCLTLRYRVPMPVG